MTETPTLQLTAIGKSFKQGKGLEPLVVLRDVSLTIQPGEIVALVGPSGSGKSTLLQIAGLLMQPSEGEITIAGKSAKGMRDGERTHVRGKQVGFVYQQHRLMMEFTALENVMLPQLVNGASRSKAKKRALELLAQVGLEDRTTHRPSALSGGEQQRVAVARSLANKPSLLLADEPTGNLDPKTAEKVFELLLEVVRGQGVAALIATHDLELASRMDRTLRMDDASVVEEKR